MTDKNISTCCACGYSWPTGKNGGHSCSEYLLKRLPLTNDGLPILPGGKVYCEDPDKIMLRLEDVISMTVSSIHSEVDFDEYQGGYTIGGSDFECGNLDCWSKPDLVPLFEH